MNQQKERNCVAVPCSSCLLKLSMLQKQTEKIENMLFSIKQTLNFKEACLYMGLSRSQLYKLAKSGHIPHYRPSGKLLYFNKQELDEWLCQNQVEESSPKEMPDSMNEYVEPNKQFAS
ncbi:helix-turn-helix domain-containing protein [Bacteroides acidifaciens]|uniref:helix-turn-helix domain-containing protein n=1 Tax=Bacteroides acidifaciens TaxID=85831 RepID=UPI0026068FA2|nr:helix-turn-helix domain-containing protein [uncultured Bacteroides sp.]